MADLLNLEEISALTGLEIPESKDGKSSAKGEEIKAQDAGSSGVAGTTDFVVSDASAGVSTSTAPQGDALASSVSKNYNFAAEDYSLKKIQPALELIYSHFQQDFQSSLSQTLRQSFTVEFQGVKSQTFQELMLSQQTFCGFNYLSCAPLDGHMYMILETGLMQRMVELYFGAKSLSDTSFDRDFTPSERRLMTQLVQQACINLSNAWASVSPLSIIANKLETQSQFVTDQLASELMCVASFNIELGMHLGQVSIAFPMALIESIKDALLHVEGVEQSKKDDVWTAKFQGNVMQTSLQLSAQFQAMEVNVADIVNLKTGDVIHLDNAQDIIFKINGKPMLMGSIAERDAQKVVKVAHWMQ